MYNKDKSTLLIIKVYLNVKLTDKENHTEKE